MARKRLNVLMPSRLLDQIEIEAKKEGLSINEFTVQMITLGLFDLQESDELENVHYH